MSEARTPRYPSPVIARRIQQIFWDNGLTDVQVAKGSGIDRKRIGEYRRGDCNPSIKFIRYICSTYHIDADWLLDI